MRMPVSLNAALALCLLPLLAHAQEPSAAAPGAVPGASAEPTELGPSVAPPLSADAADTSQADARLAAIEAELAEQRTQNARQQEALTALQARAEEAELAALMGDGGEVELEEDPLRFYGFADFGFDKFFFNEPFDDGFQLLRPTKAGSFVFGNLNFYVDAVPAKNWRALFEVRLTLAPNGELEQLGPPLGPGFKRTDTVAFDFASPSAQSQLRLGGLFIERGWVEWSYGALLKVRAGMFLNPFGIWNVDHGSPTLISLMLPTFVASRMIPTQLLGLQAQGSYIAGPFQLGYHAHVSNGRGPTDYDLTDNKALGGRLFLAHEGDYGRTVFGASAYHGTYTDMEKAIRIDGRNIFDWNRTVQYTENIGGLDLAIDAFGFRFRGEAVVRRVTYEGDLRDRIFSPTGGEWYMPDRTEYSVYGLLSYRLPWLGIEPYVEYEAAAKSFTLARYAGNSRATRSNLALTVPSVGVNVPLSAQTLFKTQVAVMQIREDKDLAADEGFDTPVFFSRLVTSF